MFGRFKIFSSYVWLNPLITLTVSQPMSGTRQSDTSTTWVVPHVLDPRQNGPPVDSNKPFLRIMPLGASITAGVHSEPEDGYRKYLRTLLRYAGFDVNMVGSQFNPTGSMANGAHEGYPGKRILEIGDLLNENGYRDHKPNVVLMHMGTNNCIQGLDYEGGADDIEDIANQFFEDNPDVTIIMSTLGPIPLSDDADSKCQDVLNPAIRHKVADMQSEDKNVFIVDFGGGYITPDDINTDDHVHPTDDAYKKYAELWYDAITYVDELGKIKSPPDTEYHDHVPEGSGGSGGGTCDKHAGDAYGPIDTQFGSAGSDDGVYHHSHGALVRAWGHNEPLTIIHSEPAADSFYFANLRGSTITPDRDTIKEDLITFKSGAERGSDTPLSVMYFNRGAGANFGDPVEFDVQDGPGCKTAGLHWEDVNGDGIDDYICISPEGNMYVSMNRGSYPPKFEYIGLYYEQKDGYSQSHVRLADIDGDGRVDYCVTTDEGDITCWRNAGTGDKPKFWQPMGQIFEGKGMGDIEGTRFVDMNGDHRADWVWMYEEEQDGHSPGATRIFTNSRGRYFGERPLWYESASAHGGFGQEDARKVTKLAKVMGERRRGADYVVVNIEKIADQAYSHTFHIYPNTGHGGAYSKGDGDHFADMTGSGRDDEIWIDPFGKIYMFENLNEDGYRSSPWTWGQEIMILDIGPYVDPFDRRLVSFADWDGDGKADVIYRSDKDQYFYVWLNQFSDGTFDWKDFTYFERLCPQRSGTGLWDIAVRFADIDNDGRADVLCMDVDGYTSGWLNHGNQEFENMGQVKKPEGHERDNLRWADVNGDGFADLLYVDNINGNTDVWYNRGPVSPRVSGSSFRWDYMGKLYEGQVRGTNQYYPDLDGNGRADLHVNNPSTNTGQTLFNICRDGDSGSGQDDPDMVDPNDPGLPECAADYYNLCDFVDCSDPPYVLDEGEDLSTDNPDLRKRNAGLMTRKGDKGSYGGNSRDIYVSALGAAFFITSLIYPTRDRFLELTPAGDQHTLFFAGSECEDTEVRTSSADTNNGQLGPLPPEWATHGTSRTNLDHPLDLQTIRNFLVHATLGDRLTGTKTSLPLADFDTVRDTWRTNNLLPVDSNNLHGSVNDVVMNAFGSAVNLGPFLPLRDDINRMKGMIYANLHPIKYDEWVKLVRRAERDVDETNEYARVENTLHDFWSVFSFINRPEHLRALDGVFDAVENVFQDLEQTTVPQLQGYQGITALWQEFRSDFLPSVTQTAYNWVRDAINAIYLAFPRSDSEHATNMRRLAAMFQMKLDKIQVEGRATPSD